MNESEIIETLKKADALQLQYAELMVPVLSELARLKSVAVRGREGCYSGDLGCWEAGTDTICLHIKDEVRGKTFREDALFLEKAIEWESAWHKKLSEAGIVRVYLSGHY